jgi:hypothetical protein
VADDTVDVTYDRTGGPLSVFIEVGIGPIGASYDLRLWDETRTKFMKLTHGSLTAKTMEPFTLPEPIADLDGLIVECVGEVGPRPAAGTVMVVKIRQDMQTIGQHARASAGGEFVFEPTIGIRLRRGA